MTETVECQGNEVKFEDCQIKYKTNHGVCKPEQSIVSVTCVHDTFASCEDNEVPWKQKCYSVYFNRPVLLLCHIAEVFFNDKIGSSYITSKNVSKNLSNENKHWCFCCLQDQM